MSNNLTLSSLFNTTKDELQRSLSGLMLPKDAARVQAAITDYLNKVCDDQSEYRQNLTQSEDYILQAALSMLNAQRDLLAAFDCRPKVTVEQPKQSEPASTTASSIAQSINSISSTKALIGAGGGALVGKLILGGWGAVFGAIAGTAIAMYLSMQNPQKAPATPNLDCVMTQPKVIIHDTPVNTALLLNVIGQICESLDNLIETFRAQIKRVVNKYESQEKPTIERDYRVLLEGIQALIGFKRGHSAQEEKYLPKLQTRVEDLAELLENYNLEVVDYTPEQTGWFEAVESANTTEVKMVYPAVCKNGSLVLRGKIFTPKQT